MASLVNRQTAKIIQFPIGARIGSAAPARRFADEAGTASVVDYDSWYHQSAVEEDGPSRKPQA